MPPTVHMVLAQRDVILLMLQRLTGTCVDTDAANSLAERYTTVDEYLRAGRFDPKVFVNCMLTIIYQQLCIAQEGKLQYETRS